MDKFVEAERSSAAITNALPGGSYEGEFRSTQPSIRNGTTAPPRSYLVRQFLTRIHGVVPWFGKRRLPIAHPLTPNGSNAAVRVSRIKPQAYAEPCAHAIATRDAWLSKVCSRFLNKRASSSSAPCRVCGTAQSEGSPLLRDCCQAVFAPRWICSPRSTRIRQIRTIQFRYTINQVPYTAQRCPSTSVIATTPLFALAACSHQLGSHMDCYCLTYPHKISDRSSARLG